MGVESLSPNEIDGNVTWFDKFAEAASRFASRAPFFIFCILVVVLWTPSLFILDINTAQLIINTLTTIITFLLVALLQNSQWRGDTANTKKLDAIADGLADLMEHAAQDNDIDDPTFENDIKELKSAVGLEKRLDTKK